MTRGHRYPLTFVAHTPEQTDFQRLLEHLTAADLVDAATARGTAAALKAIRPPATGRRTGPPHDHAHPWPTLPRSGVAAFRADCWRRQNATDFAHTDSQYRAGNAAARTWLALLPDQPQPAVPSLPAVRPIQPPSPCTRPIPCGCSWPR